MGYIPETNQSKFGGHWVLRAKIREKMKSLHFFDFGFQKYNV